jgi:outer membrane protein OmpA-like peptidoglycan-associated protein
VIAAPTLAPMPAPAASALLAKVYFDVGAATIGVDGSEKIAAAAGMIRNENLKVALTGYTDRTGDAMKNEELAKSRAAAVRDALLAAGVADANIEMRAPMFVEVGGAGGDAEARRVDIVRP